jgi:hypothetical protein
MADGCVDIVLSLGMREKYIFWHASFAKKQGGHVLIVKFDIMCIFGPNGFVKNFTSADT